MEINLKSWFLAIFILIYGIQSSVQGWQMYKYKKKSLLPIERASLWLLKTVKGEDAAKKRESELLAPKRVYKMGIYLLLVGILTMIGGVIAIIGLIGLLLSS